MLTTAETDQSEENTSSLHGDLLEAIISHVPLIDLLPAYNVSKDWRSAVCSSLANPSRVKPWLIAHVQSSLSTSLIVTRAYDPESQVWIEVPRATVQVQPGLPVRSSHSSLLYMITPSKLYFATDALVTKWHEIEGPKVWRSDPVVAVIGSYVVVAGGISDFEDDPLSVEIYNMELRQWESSKSMPDILRGSAASTWLSVAVTDKKMFLLEKHVGVFCSFDLESKTWECMPDPLRPDNSIFFSLIGFSNGRLLLIGLLGDPENVQSLKIWEVDAETFHCEETGEMPRTMLEQLIDESSLTSSINMCLARGIIYMYNHSYPKVIIYCELRNGTCKWGRVQSSLVNDQNMVMHRFVFTCSRVGMHDLQNAFGLGGYAEPGTS